MLLCRTAAFLISAACGGLLGGCAAAKPCPEPGPDRVGAVSSSDGGDETDGLLAELSIPARPDWMDKYAGSTPGDPRFLRLRSPNQSEPAKRAGRRVGAAASPSP